MKGHDSISDQAIGDMDRRRVPTANVEAFETALGELKRIRRSDPCDVLRKTVTRGARDDFIAYRFADEMQLRSWESSPEALLIRQAGGHVRAKWWMERSLRPDTGESVNTSKRHAPGSPHRLRCHRAHRRGRISS
jgi:hypothetical protein